MTEDKMNEAIRDELEKLVALLKVQAPFEDIDAVMTESRRTLDKLFKANK